MSAGPTRASAELPRSAREWEPLLCRHFLGIGPTGDATPVRSFEVTLPTLAAACGCDASGREVEVEAAFKAAFRHEPTVMDALDGGYYARFDPSEVPGCFTYLALALHIDSLLDGAYGGMSVYREKLDAWLGFGRGSYGLQGVASMWRALAAWLDDSAARGGPYRRLVLPDPGGLTRIGHTRRLAFPLRRDARLVERFASDHPGVLDKPREFIARFGAAIAGDRASWGLQAAFEEFRGAYLDGARALADHRFWRFAHRSGASAGATRLGPIRASLEMSFDEDGERTYAVRAGAHGSGSDDQRLFFASAGQAARRLKELGPADLDACFARGFLVLKQIGHGRWQSSASLEGCVGKALLACSAAALERLGTSNLAPFIDGNDGWFVLSEPAPLGRLEDALARLGANGRRTDEGLVAAAVLDGVPCPGGAWLGRPGFLPRIVADGSALQVAPPASGQAEASPIRVENDGRLRASSPVHGVFQVSPISPGGAQPPWSRRVLFVRDAVPHPRTGGAREEWEPLRDWSGPDHGGAPARASDEAPERLDWSDLPTLSDDLAEAVYAGGRSGWDEADLVTLIREGLGDRGAGARPFAPSPWDILRCFQEATFLQPRLRPRWRGRVWTLVEPRLTAISAVEHAPGLDAESEPSPMAVVDGATCAQQIEDFRRAAASLGGRPFRRSGVSPYASALVGCVGADLNALSERLAWPVAPARAAPGRAPLAVAVTERSPERFVLASRWDWGAGRFVAGASIARGNARAVRLERWAHPGGRDHDLYLVEGPRRSSCCLSRTAAIVLAHGMARAALFAPSSGGLARLAREGGLPDRIAAHLRARRLGNPGPTPGGGYLYPFDPRGDAEALAALLPGVLAGVEEGTDHGASPSSVVSLALRSGGRLRPLWSAGELSTTLNQGRDPKTG